MLIHEEGRLQICDFGVAGVLQTQLDKRSTWIGTPHWMPPEMFSMRGDAHKYGSEVYELTDLIRECTADRDRLMFGPMGVHCLNLQKGLLPMQICESGCK